MKKLTKFFGFLVVLLAFTLLFVHNTKADEPLENPVNVEITASLDADNPGVVLTDVPREYGADITVDFTSVAGTFQVWIVDGYIRTDLEKDNTFIATTDFKAIAIFSNQKDVHVYVDASGKHMQTSYVNEPTVPTAPSEKIGYTFNGYTLTETVNLVSVYRANYTRNTDVTYTINSQTYDFNEVVTLEGTEDFTHWESGGKVVSYNPNYKFTALSDLNLTEGTGGIAENLVTLRTLPNFRPEHTTYLAQFELLPGFELVEYGLEVDGEGETRILRKFNNLNPTTNEMLVSTQNSYSNVSAYMIIKETGTNTLSTVYNHDMGALREYNVTIDITVPTNTPDTIYIVGELVGSWDPLNAVAINKDGEGNYQYNAVRTLHEGNHDYKLIAGKGFGTQAYYDSSNNDPTNRTISLGAVSDIEVIQTVDRWMNIPDPVVLAGHVRVYFEIPYWDGFIPSIHFWGDGIDTLQQNYGGWYNSPLLTKSANGYFYFDIKLANEGQYSNINFQFNNRGDDKTINLSFDYINSNTYYEHIGFGERVAWGVNQKQPPSGVEIQEP